MRKGNKLIQEGKVPKKRTLNTQVLTDIVNSYYLDGIETGYKAGYDYGYEEGYRQHGQDFVADGEKAYQKGLEDGKQGVAIDGDKRYWDGYHAAQEDGRNIYQKGHNDAWNMLKYICLGGRERMLKVFGTISITKIITDNTASEAIEKIKEYEDRQEGKTEIKVGTKVRTTPDKDHSDLGAFPPGTVGTVVEIGNPKCRHRYKVSFNGNCWWFSEDMFEVIREDETQEEPQDDEIKIGDEVIYDGMKGVVDREPYTIGTDRELFVTVWFGGAMASAALANVKKTGRHFDGIENALKQIQSTVSGRRKAVYDVLGRGEKRMKYE